MRCLVALVSLVLILPVLGCTDVREGRARASVEAFEAGLAASDYASACALLAPTTRARIERAASCPRVLAERHPQPAGPVRETRVWGDRAQVLGTAGALFLVETAQGWKISAAGCRPESQGPYGCELEGP